LTNGARIPEKLVRYFAVIDERGDDVSEYGERVVGMVNKNSTGAQYLGFAKILANFHDVNNLWPDSILRSNLPNLNNTVVLVADDSATNFATLKEGLSRYGAQVMHAASTANCMGLIRDTEPDALLLDWQLGEHDGDQVLRQLSSLGTTKIPLTIVLSSTDRKLVIRSDYAEFISTILERPVSIETIARCLDRGSVSGLLTHFDNRPPDTFNASIFNTAIFDELLGQGVDVLSIRSLLDGYIVEMDLLMTNVEHDISRMDQTKYLRHLHGIKSVSDAAGAEVLSEFSAVREQSLRSSGAVFSAEIDRDFVELFTTWGLTKAHVGLYAASLGVNSRVDGIRTP